MTTLRFDLDDAVVAAPASEPVTVAEAAQHLRILGSPIYEVDKINMCLQAAREWVEHATGVLLVQRSVTAYAPLFADYLVLPHRPVQSITSVKYYDADNALQTASSSLYGLASQIDSVYLLDGSDWPDTYTRPDAVQVTYEAGYASGSPVDYTGNIPAALKSAVLLIMAELFEQREVTSVGMPISTSPTVDRLLQGWRNR